MINKLLSSLWRWANYSIEYQLNGLSGVKSNGDGYWTWGAGRSQISLTPKTSVDLLGYYMLELEVSGVLKPLHCHLLTGNDFELDINESMKFTLPVTGSNKKIIKRVCYFENNRKDLLFQFGDESGSCKDLSIRLVKLSQNKAKYFMSKKWVANACLPLSKLSMPELYKQYGELFKKTAIGSYQNWIDNNNRDINNLQFSISELKHRPKISIVCPVYNTKPEWLVACIESVKRQYYSNWQLILVDDASTSRSHFKHLDEYGQCDARIQVLYLEENKHISAATNAGIELVAGEYVTFLDHDDELAPDALFELCSVINEKPSIKIIYSDEDLMSEAGERLVPHFKSDWNPELLRAHNYITHLCCYESDLLASLGGMRLGYEGAQDYDLILRASAVVDNSEIYHIPKVLYHWRMVEGSTALSSGAKSYATDAGKRALEDHLANAHIEAQVNHASHDNFYSVKYALPSKLPKVSIIIPTRDGMDVLRPCIETLVKKTAYDNYEVVILDNGSIEEETLEFLSELSKKNNFTVIRDEGEFNYSRINNHAVTYSSGELICLLNNDIEIIQSDWLSEMVSVANRKEVGCVGAKLLYPDGTIQHAGVILGLGGYAAHSHRGVGGNEPGYFCRAQVRQQLSAVTGACLVVKRAIYDAVCGLDEAFQVAYNDVDFCLRVQNLGYQNIYTPFAELIHHESKTRGEDTGAEKTKRFNQEKDLLLSRWSALLENDPFYNPNLTRAREDFSL